MNTQSAVISLVGLGKTYRLYSRPWDMLAELISGRVRHSALNVLDAIDLEVPSGQVLGIVGRNGAGKSTLLKIIAGTLDASHGSVAVRGRLSAILELGSGFHPDYTGRENVFMGGMCLGMSRAEVESKMASIIAFSELEDVIDRPFRTYSTGMQARLTFSTAISVDPDIFIVDEALAVGDAKFQLKCFRRLMEFKERGCTIMLVSHDSGTITRFCDRAVLFERGRIVADGTPKAVVQAYHSLLFGDSERSLAPRPSAPQTASVAAHEVPSDASTRVQEAEPVVVNAPLPPVRVPGEVEHHAEAGDPLQSDGGREATFDGDGSVELLSYGIADASGNGVTLIESGSGCQLHMRFRAMRSFDRLSFGFNILDRQGTLVFGVTNLSQNRILEAVSEGAEVVVTADLTMWLAAGDFFLTLGVADAVSGQRCAFVEDAVHFRVIGPSGIYTTALVNLQARFGFECVDLQVPPPDCAEALPQNVERGRGAL